MRRERRDAAPARQALTWCTSAVCALFLVTIFIVTAATLTSSNVPVYPSALIRLDHFGFEAGGSFALHASMSDPVSVVLNVCTSDQYELLLEKHSTLNSICAPNATDLCLFTGQVSPSDSVDATRVVDVATTVEVFYINCNGNSGYMKYAFDPVNPGGEHLSTTEVPFKSTTLYVLACSGALAVLWLLHVLSKRHVAALHVWLLLSASLFALHSAVAFEYWNSKSQTGHSGLALVSLRLLADVASRSSLLVAFMLIVNGLSLVASRLDAATWRGISAMASVFGLAVFSFAIFQSLFFLLILLLVDAFIARYVLSTARSAGEHLDLQIDRAAALNIDLRAAPMHAQRSAIAITKVFAVAYLLADVSLRLLQVLTLQDAPWLVFALDQGLALLACAFLAALFRVGPRRARIFFTLPRWPGPLPCLSCRRPSRRRVVVGADDDDDADAAGALRIPGARFVVIRAPDNALAIGVVPDGRRGAGAAASPAAAAAARRSGGAGHAPTYGSAGALTPVRAARSVVGGGPGGPVSTSGDHYVRLTQ